MIAEMLNFFTPKILKRYFFYTLLSEFKMLKSWDVGRLWTPIPRKDSRVTTEGEMEDGTTPVSTETKQRQAAWKKGTAKKSEIRDL
jgi:hypothetical protein